MSQAQTLPRLTPTATCAQFYDRLAIIERGDGWPFFAERPCRYTDELGTALQGRLELVYFVSPGENTGSHGLICVNVASGVEPRPPAQVVKKFLVSADEAFALLTAASELVFEV